MKKDGSLSAKVFKWTTLTLEPKASRELSKVHKLRFISTRVYYPGTHRVEVLVNGKVQGSETFELRVPAR